MFAAPLFTNYTATVTLIALTAIFAYSYYAVLIVGQLSLGQAGLASLGGFSATLVVPDEPIAGLSPLVVGVPVGMAVGAIAAFILGLPVMRLRGVFLAIATLGFGEVVRIVLINMSWTGGAQGIRVPKLVTPSIAWIAVAVVAYWFWRLGPSRLGSAFAAIREDELAARAMGIDVSRHRMIAFVTSGAVVGLYGVLVSYFSRLITPDDFGFATAVDGLVTAVVGGSLLFVGPLLGSAFFTLLPEIQRAAGIEAGWIRPFISSMLLLVVILFLPGGLSSLVPRLYKPKVARDAAPPELEPLPEPGTPILQLSGLGKDYGGVHAVRDIDLEIRSGDVLGLIGPNGAGKTTLVNMISGLVEPTSGSGTVLGCTLGNPATAHRFAVAGVARTFQQAKLFERLTVLENVVVGTHVVSKPTFLRRLLWLPSARRDERRALAQASAQLGRVGLVDKAGVRAKQLSFGDRRRLEIARALAAHPTLLILDEPAAGMNHVEAVELSDLIGSLAADGITILLIEHNVGMVLRTCSRIVVLDFGAVIAHGTPAEISADPAVIEAYLGSEGSTT
ncbi:ATP-binding cassette domain-containing protein [Antrihabitans spumae]|uniref:ATP-binding cassette domain-containing protein n=1 Tax=Antrihabitans spumae TaxID=3373370 RepID=A0ABW7KQ68_9NOCA